MFKTSESSSNKAGDALSVRVLSPEGVIWEGRAQAVSSVNSQGPFDLLPDHAHFISLIDNHPIQVATENEGLRDFTYSTAVIRLLDDIVTIYVDVAGHSEEKKKNIRDTA